VGLPVDFATRKRVGLGMRLIHALVQQTEAKLRIERPERGTEFVLDISLKDE
jgi:two-component sensor histidine kinase